MEDQPQYEIGDILKPDERYMGYKVLPKAILITDVIWHETVADVYWAYRYLDPITNLQGQTSCYRIDMWYKKAA